MTIEWRYIEAFRRQFQRCGLVEGEVVCVLSESQSRAELVATARLAAESLCARVVQLAVPTPSSQHPVPVRSTGASQALAHNPAALAALCAADLVIDCTVEGLLHASELPAILAAGTRVLMISNEHLDVFDRLVHDDTLGERVGIAHQLLRAASEMAVTSEAGTDLTVQLDKAFVAGSSGRTDGPGTIAHWPGGLVVAFPAAHSVAGTLVLAPGDLNLTFNRYAESPVVLTIVDDHIVDIAGSGVDAQLFRSYLGAFETTDGTRSAYATSHVGWGMNREARWDAVALYDRRELWGTEQRAFAGNFLYSCGASEHAGRYTAGHFDLPMRGCTVCLDGRPVIVKGQLIAELR